MLRLLLLGRIPVFGDGGYVLRVAKYPQGQVSRFKRVHRDHCETFGVPKEMTSDGGSAYVSGETQQFFSTWGITHRLSSAYNPHGNLRAEQGVKTRKRLIKGNLGSDGKLDNDRFMRPILMYRNSPARDTGCSLAQVIFGRVLWDCMPIKK